MVNDIAVQDFVNAIKETPTDTNTTYQATVSRIDDEGVVWVCIHGSEKETPTASTSAEVKRGDSVTVQWRSNKLYIGGNYSNPSAGVVRVASVEQDAARAFLAAENAEYDAARAHEAADRAEAEAERAYGEAERATGYANDSLSQLGVVEDVVGTLNWITTHATYKSTEDTEVHAGKWYFTKSGDSYNVVVNPTGNPAQQGWYEIDTIQEAVANYVSSHLALTDAGLWVTKDGNGYKILLANDGMKVFDAGGHLVSTFGESITFDSARPQTIGNESTYIKWYDSNNDRTADSLEISGQNVNITSSVTIGGKPQSEYLNSNIEVGGRNLLQHTDDYADWTLSGVTQTDSTPTDILNYTQISSDANAVAVCTYRFPYSYIRNKTITFSCLAKAAANTNMEMFWEIDLHADTTSSRLKYTTQSMDFTATGNWQKVSRTVDVKDSIFTLGTGSPNYETCYARILLHRLPACHYAVQVKELMSEVGNVASDWSLATEDLQNSISAAQSTADNAAPKASAVYRSQRIYYRKTSSGAPNKNETWLSTSGTGYGNWSLSIPQLTSGTTKYPYLYTAVQTQTVAQYALTTTPNCSCSTVLLDDTTTVIDGGTITTGIVSANRLNIGDVITAINNDGTTTISGGKITTGTLSASAVDASSGTFNEANIPNLNASKITAGTIAVGVLPDDALNSNIEVGGRNLALGTATSFTNSGTSSESKSYNLTTALPTGTQITISCKVDATNLVLGGNNKRVGISLNVTKDGGGTQYIEAWCKDDGTYTTYISSTATLLGAITLPKTVTFYIQQASSGSVTLSELKVEVGNVATGWTPAPEDVEAFTEAFSSAKQISTYARSFTKANWDSYGASGHSESWTASGYDNSHISVGDIAYINGSVSDKTGWYAVIIGTVTSVTASAVVMTSITVAYNSSQAEKYITKVNDAGIRIHPSSTENNSVLINADGMTVYKGGTTDAYSVAFYGDTARVGKSATRHVEVKDGGMQVYQDSTYVMAHIGYGTTNNGSGTETAPYYTFGHRNSGYTNGKYSVCEGYDCAASQADAHAEGMGTKATATAAHSEGSNTTASGSYSHAEGYQTTASGYGAHASGYGTTAQAFGQTAVGRYNVAQGTSNTMVSTDNAFIIGNGSSLSSRSNALAVTYQGNMTIAGTLTQGSDRRLKDHISYVGDEAIEFINGLKPAHYIKDGEKHVGFYAQDVEAVDKWDCMVGEMNGYMTLGYMELLAPMVAYIQRLEKRIEELERSK